MISEQLSVNSEQLSVYQRFKNFVVSFVASFVDEVRDKDSDKAYNKESVLLDSGRQAAFLTRRAFLAGAGRYGLLSFLAALAAALGRRARVDHRCSRQGVCGGCAARSTCLLPAAQSRRQAEKRS